MAAEGAKAAVAPHIPYDCYTESSRIYGDNQGKDISDLDLISGLDIKESRLVAIAACTDMSTRLISGVKTTWGVWDADTSAWTGV